MTRAITIGPPEEVSPAGWDDLARACPWGTFCHSTINLELVRNFSPTRIIRIAARDADNELVGGIAFGVQDGPLGPVVNCLPYYGSYGDALVSPVAPAGTEGALYCAFLDYCYQIDALCLTVITSPFADIEHAERVRGFVSPTFVDQRNCQVAFMPSPEGYTEATYRDKLLACFEGRARTAIRKAIKSGFRLATAANLDEAREFAGIHRENIGGRGGNFKTEAFFVYTYQQSLRDAKASRLVLAFHGNEVVAGVAFFEFGNTLEYHTTGLKEASRPMAPLNLIIWEAMVEAGMRGLRNMNFGGTWKSQEGVYNFKKSFGTHDKPYFYFTRFFRDLARAAKMTPQQIQEQYPLCFVLPFSELSR